MNVNHNDPSSNSSCFNSEIPRTAAQCSHVVSDTKCTLYHFGMHHLVYYLANHAKCLYFTGVKEDRDGNTMGLGESETIHDLHFDSHYDEVFMSIYDSVL